ncbi:hypothetical protein HYW76_03945 [Candidatus Pacearchaeota archaeon]|nr:hypothetical protein [Candidatus Pacearchaeota archaeon]
MTATFDDFKSYMKDYADTVQFTSQFEETSKQAEIAKSLDATVERETEDSTPLFYDANDPRYKQAEKGKKLAGLYEKRTAQKIKTDLGVIVNSLDSKKLLALLVSQSKLIKSDNADLSKLVTDYRMYADYSQRENPDAQKNPEMKKRIDEAEEKVEESYTAHKEKIKEGIINRTGDNELAETWVDLLSAFPQHRQKFIDDSKKMTRKRLSDITENQKDVVLAHITKALETAKDKEYVDFGNMAYNLAK